LLNANLVFNWRRRYGGTTAFLPVAIAAPERPVPGAAARVSEGAAGEIEISLASGHRVRIRGGFDPERVARLLRGLSS
jgi:transposase